MTLTKEEARFLSDRETLESKQGQKMQNSTKWYLNRNDLKLLNVLPENYEIYMNEKELKGNPPKYCLNLLRHLSS